MRGRQDPCVLHDLLAQVLLLRRHAPEAAHETQHDFGLVLPGQGVIGHDARGQVPHELHEQLLVLLCVRHRRPVRVLLVQELCHRHCPICRRRAGRAMDKGGMGMAGGTVREGLSRMHDSDPGSAPPDPYGCSKQRRLVNRQTTNRSTAGLEPPQSTSRRIFALGHPPCFKRKLHVPGCVGWVLPQ